MGADLEQRRRRKRGREAVHAVWGFSIGGDLVGRFPGLFPPPPMRRLRPSPTTMFESDLISGPTCQSSQALGLVFRSYYGRNSKFFFWRKREFY